MSQYSTLQSLVLYDIVSELPGYYWSPNPAKPRFIMSYKGLPFVTIWVEYKDISIAMKSIGAKPNKDKRVDGTDVYSIPVLSDPNTGAIITDSLEIASYLEKTYPEKSVFANKSEAQIRAFDATHTSLNLPSIATIFLRSTEIMGASSVKFFVRVRSMDHVPLPWEARYDADWESLEKAHNTMYEWYQKSNGKWIMGDFSYADIIVACRVLWYKRVLKEDEWAKISAWHGGKWVQVLADVEKECNLA
ncbi:hypothetical protein DEU56DRAFT_973119 [Suillus clintonianus]|uniref:uncharacterized protein n=1 Tax=Suillus clintonianus TaxID=1904413 RepID=UPI001B863BEF|nr:uncharacterized protein DEU56DRAFT_973119 [Suillus clintonianus]KAG2133341.1 hypothetical protein DEU56DRAFT_973119 [Suillus clintonianus]